MNLNVEWHELPLLLTVKDLRRLGLTRGEAYQIAYQLGRKIRRRLLIPRSALQAWAERQN